MFVNKQVAYLKCIYLEKGKVLQCAIYVILFFIWRRMYWKILGITKPSTQLHPAPSTSTQLISNSTELHPPPRSSFQPPPSSIHLHPAHFSLHPAHFKLHRAPSTSTQLISNSTQLHPPPPSSFQPPPSFLQHPQQYLKQNVARNWAISPNLGQKIKSCPFWLKIGTHGILEVSRLRCPNVDVDVEVSESRLRFLKFWPQIHF